MRRGKYSKKDFCVLCPYSENPRIFGIRTCQKVFFLKNPEKKQTFKIRLKLTSIFSIRWLMFVKKKIFIKTEYRSKSIILNFFLNYYTITIPWCWWWSWCCTGIRIKSRIPAGICGRLCVENYHFNVIWKKNKIFFSTYFIEIIV